MASKYKFLPSPATGCLTDEDTKRYFSRLGFAVFALTVSVQVFGALFSILYGILAASFPILNDSIILSIADMLISILCIYGIGLPIFLLVSRALPSAKPIKSGMQPSHFLGSFCITVLMSTIGSYISTVIISMFEVFLGSTPENSLAELATDTNVWVVLVFAVIIIPILEEILFRKVVCSKLLPLGEGYAIFVSAGVFSLIHGNFYQFAYAFLLGAFFAFIYVKTGKLIYSCILHIFVNFTGLILAPAIVNAIDATELEAILESGSIDPNSPIFSAIYLLMFYSLFSLVMNIIGIFLLSKAFKKKKMTLESGLLPPPKENRFSNFFLSTGVALAIAFFVILFVLTLLEPVLTPMIESYIGGTL